MQITIYPNLTVEKVSIDITNIFPAVSTHGSRVFIIIKIKIFLVRNEVLYQATFILQKGKIFVITENIFICIYARNVL